MPARAGQFELRRRTHALLRGASPNQFNSFATFLLGFTTSIGTSAPMESPITTRNWAHGFYVRDQLQATRNLTLTLGLRHEYYPMSTRANRGMELYDPETNQMLIGGVGSIPNDVGIQMSKKLFAAHWRGLSHRHEVGGPLRIRH